MKLAELTESLIDSCGLKGDEESEVKAKFDEDDGQTVLYVVPDSSKPDEIRVICRL